jgi:hypothetical protein
MSSCFALTKRGKRCRGYATVLEEGADPDGTPVITYDLTCNSHRSFFEKNQDYLLNLLFGHTRTGQYGSQYAVYLEFFPAKRDFVECLLMYKCLVPTKEMIEKLYEDPFGRLSYFIYLVAKHVPEFSKSWNPKLWENTIRNFWIYYYSVGPIQISFSMFYPFFREDPLNHFLDCIYIRGQIESFTTNEEVDLEIEVFARKYCMYTEYSDALMYSANLEEKIEKLHERFQTLQSIPIRTLIKRCKLLPILLEERNMRYIENRRAVHIKVYKKELMERTWESSRFIDWCLDIEEKEEVLQRWASLPFCKT